MDKNAFDLGHLSLTNELSANEISANGYLRCYVCESKKADYPVGTTFKDVHTENQMIVAGYFPAGSTWMPDSLFHSTNAVVTLDDYIVSEMDEGYFQIDNQFYGNIFNSCYIKHVSEEQSEQVLSELKELADTVGVLCYVHTLNQLVETEKEDNKDLINSVGILTLFVILVSLSSVCTACLSDVFSRRSDTAIMSITGVSPTDLYMMLLVENLLKWLIAFCLASAIYLNGQDADGSHVFTTMLLPVCALGGLVCMAAITTISQISMKQKHLLDWIGGSKL